MALNKKGAIQVAWIVWGIIAIVGIFLAKPYLFSTITPPYLTPPSGTESLVNKYYYDPATSEASWSCQTTTNYVKFRTSDTNYGSGTSIAYGNCGSQLNRYGYYTCTGCNGVGTTGSCTSISGYTLVVSNLPGQLSGYSNWVGSTLYLLKKDSDPTIMRICIQKGGNYAYQTYDSDANGDAVSTSNLPVTPSNEAYCGTTPIKDLGKYACEGGNVVKKYCGTYGYDLIQDCEGSQTCEFLDQRDVPEGKANVVKCSGDYKPSKNLCVGSTLYSTDSTGGNINSVVCGYTCLNGACQSCKDGNTRCDPNNNMNIELCTGNVWVPKSNGDCYGEQSCTQSGSVSSGTSYAECTSPYTSGWQRCGGTDGKQPQTYVGGTTQQFVDDGAPCDIGCTETNHVASCTLQCQNANSYFCQDGQLKYCDDADRDNEVIEKGDCVSSSCTTDNSRCAPNRNTGESFCFDNTHVYSGVSTNDNYDVYGGVKDTLSTTCVGQERCSGDTDLKHAFCTSDFLAGDRRCSGLQPQIYVAGTTQDFVNDGDVCDIGCDVSLDSRCTLQCSPLGYYCEVNKIKKCEESDRDYEITSQQTCYLNQCNSDNTGCKRIRQPGQYYCNNTMQVSLAYSSGNVSDIYGGVLTEPYEDCIGLETCQESGLTASCVSNHSVGEERCLGNMPQEYTGDPIQNFIDKQRTPCGSGCYTDAEGKAKCTMQCEPVGYWCVGGVLSNCVARDADNDVDIIGVCDTGNCTLDNSKCQARRTVNDIYCYQGDRWVTKDSNDDYDLNGGIYGELLEPCDNGCTYTNGVAGCTKKIGCTNGGEVFCQDSTTRIVCSADGQSYLTTEDCTQKGAGYTCQSGVCVAPQAQCSGTNYCDGNVIKQCNSGQLGSTIETCNNKGCTGGANPQCKDECTSNNVCEGRFSYVCEEKAVLDIDELQRVKTSNYVDCGSVGCDTNTGQCLTFCTPNSNYCASGEGVLRSCTSQGRPGNIIDDCNGMGCDSSTNLCNSGCTSEGYSCSSDGMSSIRCYRDTQNLQLLSETTKCGIGCKTSTGKCENYAVNSYICAGASQQSLYLTDSNGILPQTPLKICSNEVRNGMQAYCISGKTDCVVCSLNEYLCDANSLSQCGNEYTGAKTNIQNCEAGCVNIGTTTATNFKCDQVQAVISPTQNFNPDEAANIKGTMKGSSSGLPLKNTQFNAVLKGEGRTTPYSGYTDSNGEFIVPFGSLTIGKYNTTITFSQYSKEYVVSTGVTNSYVLTKETKDVLVRLPGEPPSFTITAKDSNGNPPDNLVLSTKPSNVSISIEPTDVLTKWEVIMDAPAGTYTIGVKAEVDGVQLDEQVFKIGISVPKLSAEVTMPSNAKPGEYNYDVKIKGASEYVTPDSAPSAKMVYNGVPSSLNLQDMGGGAYSFSYNFAGIGTYTLQLKAEKDGYTPITAFQKQIYISPSGEPYVAPKLTTSTTGNVTGGVGGTPPSTDNIWIYVAAAIVVGAYFIFGGKKRR